MTIKIERELEHGPTYISIDSIPLIKITPICPLEIADQVAQFAAELLREETPGHPWTGQQLVVVNTTQNLYANEKAHPIMGLDGEMHTYPDIESAGELVFEMWIEHDHTPETAQVFRLVPVPIHHVKAAVRAHAEAMPPEDLAELGKSVQNLDG